MNNRVTALSYSALHYNHAMSLRGGFPGTSAQGRCATKQSPTIWLNTHEYDMLFEPRLFSAKFNRSDKVGDCFVAFAKPSATRNDMVLMANIRKLPCCQIFGGIA
jgi:hypothetical protein